MVKPLLSASQLMSIQKVAESGMQVTVIFKHPEIGSDDLGDGAPDPDPQVVATVQGYLRQTGGDTIEDVSSGTLGIGSTYELGVPIGTPVLPRDIAEILGKTYYVQDVKDDETWPAMLNVTLRRRD